MGERLIHLAGRACSVVIDVSRADMPVWRHWGARLPADVAVLPVDDTTPVPTFALDQTVPFSVFPMFGDGWFGPSALLCHRSGRDWAQGASGFTVEASANTAVFQISDEVAGLSIRHALALDPDTDILTLSSTLTNRGDGPLQVQQFLPGCLPLPARATRVESFSGRHFREFMPDHTTIGRSGWRRESRRGLTSHACPPLASVLSDEAGQHAGEVWSAQLAWSGNHQQSIDWLDDGRRVWMAGEWFAPGEIELAPGERLSTPEWLATYSPEGRDGAARNFHAAIRTRGPGLAQSKPRPVHLNTWEGVYFNHSETDLKALATEAASLGVERFVLDDGWFKGRKDDTSSLGDWVPDRNTYPEGLAPLANHVKALGMEFGLWIEPEMVNPDSDLNRAHPDWALQIKGRPPRTARNQLVLDLSRPEVQDYLFDRLDVLIGALAISYLKWDHNRDLTQAGDATGRPAYRKQVLATYALIDRLRAAHANIEIESCAGGGGRIDAGMLTRTDRVWTSDCIDAVSRIEIQRGFLNFFPPEIMGAHIGASPAHSTGRRQSMAFRVGVACTGHLGVELDPRTLTPKERAELAAWIAFYKSVRDQLHGNQVWRGDAGDDLTWQAHGDSRQFLLFVYRLAPTGLRFPPSIRLPFLANDRRYAFRRIDPGPTHPDNSQPVSFAKSDGASFTLHGAIIAQEGLPCPHLKAETCLVIEAKAV
ncbi:MAG: alpha-galactosidase [Pseudomonadota bacterium]